MIPAPRRPRALALALGAVLALAIAGCELGPLGGTALRGERVAEPVRDWSFAEPGYVLEIQTHARALLPSASTWFVVQDGALWLYAMSTGDLEPPWLARLREDPGVTIRVDGRLHEGRARLVTDPAALEPLLPRVLAKYHMVQVDDARFAAPSGRFPGTQIRHWFFRVEAPAG